jgi:hypothetical protein
VSLTEAHKNIEIGIIMKIKLSNNQIKLRAGLFALLKGLVKITPCFEWKVLGKGKDSIYNLLGFENYAKYLEFMLHIHLFGVNGRTGTTQLWDRKFIEAQGTRPTFVPRVAGNRLRIKIIAVGRKGKKR